MYVCMYVRFPTLGTMACAVSSPHPSARCSDQMDIKRDGYEAQYAWLERELSKPARWKVKNPNNLKLITPIYNINDPVHN